MKTQINTAYILADQDAPGNKELLIEQAFDGIITPRKEKALRAILFLSDEECMKIETELNMTDWR